MFLSLQWSYFLVDHVQKTELFMGMLVGRKGSGKYNIKKTKNIDYTYNAYNI